jgi:hypothetical protein
VLKMMGLRIFLFSLFAGCLCLLPGAARAGIFSCPALFLVVDPPGAYQPPLPAVSLTNAVVSSNATTGAVIVCNYRTQITAIYSGVLLYPFTRSFCPQFTLTAVTSGGLVIPDLNFPQAGHTRPTKRFNRKCHGNFNIQRQGYLFMFFFAVFLIMGFSVFRSPLRVRRDIIVQYQVINLPVIRR